MAHFFVVVGGSKIHERMAHFFIDIYTEYFGLTNKDAAKAATQICDTVQNNWTRLAEHYGLSRGAIEYMRPAFSLER